MFDFFEKIRHILILPYKKCKFRHSFLVARKSQSYLCSMEKKTLILWIGVAMSAHTASAQFNTVAKLPNLYKVEVVNAVNDYEMTDVSNIVTYSPASFSEQTAEPSENDETYKKIWTDRFLSVCYPLRHIKINSPFGYRKDPFTGKKKYHNGLDLHARCDEVFAMMDGVVVKVGQDSASGKYVTLQHGAYTVSYCHLSRTIATKGAVVKAGTVVGITGSTGRSTGEHLHITCKLNGKNIDPLLLLDFIKATREECVAALVKVI